GNSDTNGTSVVYQVSTDSGTTWSPTTANQTNLVDGTYEFRTIVTDPAGNSSTSNTIRSEERRVGKEARTLASANLTDTGTTNTPQGTSNSAFCPTHPGNSDTNGTSVVYQVSTDSGTTWSPTTANQTNLVDGTYEFRTIVTDPAGNSSTSNTI